MEIENLNNLLITLKNVLEKNNFDEDEPKIQFLCNSLKNIRQEIPDIAQLEELKKVVNYLEVKYDEFNELSYYFNPLYIKIKNKIHDETVKKIREKNRRKRGMK